MIAAFLLILIFVSILAYVLEPPLARRMDTFLQNLRGYINEDKIDTTNVPVEFQLTEEALALSDHLKPSEEYAHRLPESDVILSFIQKVQLETPEFMDSVDPNCAKDRFGVIWCL